MKKISRVLISAVLVLSFCAFILAGCSSTATNSTDAKGSDTSVKATESKATAENKETKKFVFGYSCMTLNNPFFVTLEKSIREEVEKSGGKMITLDPQLDMQKQISQIEDMISQKVDLIFLNPVDWKGIKPSLDAAKAANIPIVNFDANVFDTDLVNSIVVSDNYNAGKVCGVDLAEKLPDGGEIAILDCPTIKSVVDRINGFTDGLGDKKDKFKVVAQQDGKVSLEVSMPIADAILQAHPTVKAFMCGNDQSALGVIAALKAAKKSGILVYGVDGSPDAKGSIKDGDMTGTGAQSPVNIGKESYKTAMKILIGEQFEKMINVDTILIDAKNIGDFSIEDWQ